MIKSFTLLEAIFSMIISAIIISACYLAFQILGSFMTNVANSAGRDKEILLFNNSFSGHWEKADLIIKADRKIQLFSHDSLTEWQFIDSIAYHSPSGHIFHIGEVFLRSTPSSIIQKDSVISRLEISWKNHETSVRNHIFQKQYYPYTWLHYEYTD